VSAVVGTSEDGNALGQSGKCVKSGKSSVIVLTVADQKQADQLLASGRVQLSLADTYVAQQQVAQSNGAFMVAGPPYHTLFYGIATSKHTHLDRALIAALEVLIMNGAYKSILARWGLQAGALPASQVRANSRG
jgi:polar amino acid transport system substrate-binding protein